MAVAPTVVEIALVAHRVAAGHSARMAAVLAASVAPADRDTLTGAVARVVVPDTRSVAVVVAVIVVVD